MAKKQVTFLTLNDKRLLKAVGFKIQELRDKKNLSVYDVTGNDMPVKSRQHWRRIEAGQKNINLTTLFKVAETLNAAAEDFLRGL